MILQVQTQDQDQMTLLAESSQVAQAKQAGALLAKIVDSEHAPKLAKMIGA
jgi:hypothetical protein